MQIGQVKRYTRVGDGNEGISLLPYLYRGQMDSTFYFRACQIRE